jgi:CRISPR-associated protein Cas1
LNPLHLSGYGVKIKVENMRSRSNLHVTNGRADFNEDQKTYSFRPRRIPYDSIIIDGHSGYISLQAFHWLSRNKIPVFILGYDGSMISSILPPMPVKADLRVAQIDSYRDPRKRFTIAHELVKTKIQRSLDVLHWLQRRYDIAEKTRKTELEALRLSKASTVNDLRMVEGRVAQYYWEAYQSVFPECLDFRGRLIRGGRANDASDPTNLALNYGYGVLEGECRRAINAVGLEPSIGFLHESTGSQTKQSLVYDLQEPYRWLVDVSVIRAFESGVLDLPDFYFTGDDYRYHIDVEAKRRFMNLLQEQFNAGIRCNGRVLKWDTVIEQKAKHLGRFLVVQSSIPEFDEPAPRLDREDNHGMQSKILALTPSKVK